MKLWISFCKLSKERWQPIAAHKTQKAGRFIARERAKKIFRENGYSEMPHIKIQKYKPV